MTFDYIIGLIVGILIGLTWGFIFGITRIRKRLKQSMEEK